MAAGVRFICNNFWQSVARHHVDCEHETAPLYTPAPFAPGDVRRGDIVFVKTDFLDLFVTHFLPLVPTNFVLVTGHSDCTPSDFARAALCAHPRVSRWYAPNLPPPLCPKTVALPLGLSEPDRPIGDQRAVEACMAAARRANKEDGVLHPFMSPTHPVRLRLNGVQHPLLVKQSGVRASFKQYLETMARYKYVLCARGNGADVHRVHEALLVRTVPVYVSEDVVPAIFDDLPVIVVRRVDDVPAVLDGLAAGRAGLLRWESVDWHDVQRYMRVDCMESRYGIDPLARCTTTIF